MSLTGLKIVSDIFRLQYIADSDINMGCFGGFLCVATGGIPDFVLQFTPLEI